MEITKTPRQRGQDHGGGQGKSFCERGASEETPRPITEEEYASLWRASRLEAFNAQRHSVCAKRYAPAKGNERNKIK